MGQTQRLRRLPADSPLAELLAVIDQDGGLVIEGMFPERAINQLREDVLAASKAIEPGAATQGLGEMGKVFTGNNTIRFSGVGKISSAYFELLDNPLYAALADQVLLPICGSYWVNTAQVMLIGPNSEAQMLHRDCGNWDYVSKTNWPHSPEVTLSAMIALDEITEVLGATRVIPGSHKWANWEDEGTPEQTVPAEMKPGDALVYTGKVIHGGGANQTADQWRNAMHLSFVAGWLTPEESSPIDYSDDDLKGCSPRVQRLLGHRSYNPAPHHGGGLWLRDARAIEETADL